ncbi:GNAT family N-acetyltransferase [Paracoccus saliphilus]|uniref:GNAT family N-acetyltransferase n=1 Tax=Paracoccus saliphilus TaxID=405559 RepID=A0AA46A5B6_9RHOB|nr:GNAT family protein [Paracoccus saliphilus]WCR02543.1 GNAT family N-acetyltransferase [Paracoccus saliphilus]SIS77170.1 Protein N-acetyltransferase, RimJ/RimL family [Paracoccus saliphilus]
MSGAGKTISGFTPRPAPGNPEIDAVWARLERLDPGRHAEPIFEAVQGADHVWDYLAIGPFPDLDAYREWQAQMAAASDPCFYAVVDPRTGLAMGVASFMRIDPANGVIEIGNIMLSPALQRNRIGSAALMAMIRWAFEAGYRRVEWKCNALNAPSRRAALRFGFRFEGVFRQHMIVKDCNRDTAWFSIIDGEWPALDAAYRQWLAPGNFDAEGLQRQSLSSLTAQALPGRSGD